MSCNIGVFLKGQVSSCKSGTSLNVPELEADRQLTDDGQTYAKEQLRVKPNGAKLLGLSWDKVFTLFQFSLFQHRKRNLVCTVTLICHDSFCTEYFVTIPEVPTTFTKSLNFEQNHIRQLFF